jgi:alpha-L-fucosidase
MIGNNHHLTPLPEEDFQMFEKDLPGHNTTGFGGAEVSPLPLETCETINDSWGFNITDRNYKSTEALIHYLVRAAGYGSNFLLNIGPMPNGVIQPEFIQRLQAMGEWLKANGETIYGTKGGFTTPQSWGAITESGQKVYLHLLKTPEDKFMIKVPYKLIAARTRANGKPVAFQVLGDNYVVFDLKSVEKQAFDTILELQVQK